MRPRDALFVSQNCHRKYFVTIDIPVGKTMGLEISGGWFTLVFVNKFRMNRTFITRILYFVGPSCVLFGSSRLACQHVLLLLGGWVVGGKSLGVLQVLKWYHAKRRCRGHITGKPERVLSPPLCA